jgi:hypothetical protein
MSDLPRARAVPSLTFAAKGRRKKKLTAKFTATSCGPSFEEVRPFLSGKRLRGLTETDDTEDFVQETDEKTEAKAKEQPSELAEIWAEDEPHTKTDKRDAA